MNDHGDSVDWSFPIHAAPFWHTGKASAFKQYTPACIYPLVLGFAAEPQTFENQPMNDEDYEGCAPTVAPQGLQLAPVLDSQSRNPGKMRGVAGDEHAAVFQGGGGDDQIGIVAGMAALASHNPKVGRSVEDGLGYGQNVGVLTEGRKAGHLGRGVLILVAAGYLVPRDRRKGELTVLLHIREGLLTDVGVAEFDQFRKDVRIQKRRRHGLLKDACEVGALADRSIKAVDLVVA